MPDSSGTACTALSCDDGKECTVDSCGEDDTCVNIPREGSCTDDASSCTDEVCNSGMCTHPSNGSCPCADASDCNDSNPCTDDACSTDRKCVYTANTASCEDDGKECTDDVCEAKSCVHPERTGTCTDEGGANGSCTDDVCDMGLCTHPRNASCQCINASECMDDEACTDDSCGSDHKCARTNSTGPCEADSDSCTCDVCSMGMCQHMSGVSCGASSAIIINNFNSNGDWIANQTTPLHLAITKTSLEATNLEAEADLYVAESGTGAIEMAVPSLTGLTKIVVEIKADTANTASMIELGVFDSSTSMWKDRALSLYGTIPLTSAGFGALEVPLVDFAVEVCKITKVRLKLNVTGGEKIWRIQGITAE